MNKNVLANLCLILCAVIFLNNLIAILLKTEINKTTFMMSMLLAILLLINGIVYKLRTKNN